MKRKNRRIISAVLVIVMFVTLVAANMLMVNARALGEIRVRLDGRYLVFDVPPMIVNGRTLVPFRVIFEELGWEVNWNDETRTASGTRQGLTIELPMTSKMARINGLPVGLDAPAMTWDGRTLVPLRFVAEAGGAEVEWNGVERVVIITRVVGGELNATPQCCVDGEEDNSKIPQAMTTPQLEAMAFELAVLELVNVERANNGLPPIRWDSLLAETARAHSMDMMQRDFFAHVCPDGRDHRERMSDKGILWRVAAENIAAGYRTPEDVVAAWMNVQGHRRNILNQELTHMGVGFYGYRWTQKFLG